MRLLIVSHTEHYLLDGQFYGWGPTVREIDHLASLFEQVTHLAFLHPGTPPASALPYKASNVSVLPVPSSGGETFSSKLDILLQMPLYLQRLSLAMDAADVVHVRCPASISMLAIIVLTFRKHPRSRWIKYAGNWQPEGPEPWSYRFQRWWLRKDLPRALVTVNGNWPHQPAHVHPFLNPGLTEEERRCAAALGQAKQMQGTLRMIFAGRVESAKGMEMTLLVLAQLHQEGIPVTLDVAGDGPERAVFEAMALEMKLKDAVRFHGWVPRTMMGQLYTDAHLIILPTTASEGWPKVLSEAMAYGVVPVASDVSSIGQYLRRFDLGCAVKPVEVQSFVEAVKTYARDPHKWKEESERSIAAAGHFTYNAYLDAVKGLLDLPAL